MIKNYNLSDDELAVIQGGGKGVNVNINLNINLDKKTFNGLARGLCSFVDGLTGKKYKGTCY
ncbi:hypothetical protein [Streptococcus pluranimalium]|uniref:hypothetical protein n=1 Tax=Streptococcus pluranimalium TaxID=82348 RepID=UPI002414FE9F|nr:hypothetical protein [Streptococcus pluranimalium]WFM79286.1 hypothetical protein P7F70_07045 [Streptococcus pluranimalium]HEM6117098.1 hypothetical protein [Streptococcus suis]HEM6117511.1 hypothetical protein [Streptococcus suis]